MYTVDKSEKVQGLLLDRMREWYERYIVKGVRPADKAEEDEELDRELPEITDGFKPDEDEELAALIQQYAEIQDAIKYKGEVQAQIIERLGGWKKYSNGIYRAVRVRRVVKGGLDQAKLKREHPDIWKACQKEGEFVSEHVRIYPEKQPEG